MLNFRRKCLVFGANAGGFHGAGGAGKAFKFDPDIPWREDPHFQIALQALNNKRAGKPYNKQDLIGKLAILGSVHFMEGLEGCSYGIITTEAPNRKGFVDDAVLQKELEKLIQCAKENSDTLFECTNFGLKRPHGFSWWTKEQMNELWKKALNGETLPTNLVPPKYINLI